MNYKQLANTGMYLSEVGFGMWGLSSWEPLIQQEIALKIMNYAIENGINFFDSAYVYGEGYSDELLKIILKQNKDLIIATKVPSKQRDYNYHNFSECFNKKYIFQITYDTLKRLDLERLSLLQLHNWNFNWPYKNLEKIVSALKEEGLIQAFGISLPDKNDLTDKSVREIGMYDHIDFFQIPHNLFQNNSETINYFKNHKKGVIIRSPFMQGLIGKDKKTILDNQFFRKRYSKRLDKYALNLEELKKTQNIIELSKHSFNLGYTLNPTSILISFRNKERINDTLSYLF